jgi:hypothetical protein
MKKPVSLLLLIFSLLFYCCTKDNDLSMDFKLTGVENKTITRGTAIQIDMKVFYLGGEKEDATVSPINFPQGISITLTNETGEPDFELSAVISVDINTTPGNYPVAMKVVSESGKEITRDFIITVVDPANHIPIITLAGSTNTTWTLNDVYTEPGYLASDVEDGNITSQVTVQGSVNYDLVGVYHVFYKIVDSDGDSSTAARTVTVLNSNAYLQGAYNCTTVTQNGPTFSWVSYVQTSPIHNLNFALNQISDCLGTTADPLTLEVIPLGTSGLDIPTQTVFGWNTSHPDHCDTAYHTFTGTGTISYTLPYTIVLNYSEFYKDSDGTQHFFNKTDTYVKQ